MTVFLPGALMAISEGAKPFARFSLSGASVLVVVHGLRTLKRIASGKGELVRLFAQMASLLTAILTGFVVLLVFAVVFPKWAPVIAGALLLVGKFGPKFGLRRSRPVRHE